MQKYPKVSIIIPTLKRQESLEKCLQSIGKQTFPDYEVILVTEEGSLAELRNQGARRAKGEILVFTDDDVIVSPQWLHAIVSSFASNHRIAGVSGPALITQEFRRNRDLFNIKWAKYLYDVFFCEGRQRLPGHMLRSGAWTTGASEGDCNYEGRVDFLEACNMAFRADIFNQLGGFDTEYKGIGDWSEPDLSFRVRRAGYDLWFSRDARLEHQPSRSGAFKKRRADAKNRMANYELFSRRWIRPCLRHTLYKLFMRTYYEITSFK